MKRTMNWVCLLAAMVFCTVGATAQVRHVHPEKFERATKVDDNGLVQWADYKAPKCRTCKGTGKMKCTTCERYPDEAKICPDCGRNKKREAVCHACAGTGSWPDPLEKVLCLGCQGAGYITCGSCPGSGILKLGTGAKRWSNCIGCRGKGFFKCMICNGKRLIPVVKLKPSLRDADAETLKKALAATDEILSGLNKVVPVPKKTRKAVKALNAAFKPGKKIYPSLKQLPKQIKQLMKMTYAGSNYQGQDEREANSVKRLRSAAEYYMKHQKRMMELALKRAEANAKLGK